MTALSSPLFWRGFAPLDTKLGGRGFFHVRFSRPHMTINIKIKIKKFIETQTVHRTINYNNHTID